MTYQWTHPSCGKIVVGRRTEHCPACHRDFKDTSSGDLHRVGPHEPAGQRRCRSDEELTELGLDQDEFGRWHRPMSPERRAALEAMRERQRSAAGG